jgi:hypothetical protein
MRASAIDIGELARMAGSYSASIRTCAEAPSLEALPLHGVEQ